MSQYLVFSQVLDNLMANAIYWLKGKSESSERRLSISLNREERTIVICNNGPNV